MSRRKFLKIATASAGLLAVGDLTRHLASAKAEDPVAFIRGVNFYGQGAGSLSTGDHTQQGLLDVASQHCSSNAQHIEALTRSIAGSRDRRVRD